jgi:hypothetical protein
MLVFIQFRFFFILLIVSHVSSLYHFKPSITCFKKYEHEETRSEALNITLSRWYSESIITRRSLSEGKLCSTVGCACFSYQRVCSHSSSEYYHFSQCTATDRQNGTIKWHRGVTSNSTCEQMSQLLHIYRNLTCCYTDRCNDQPGKITKIVDTHVLSQLHDTNDSQILQTLRITHKPIQFDSTSSLSNNSLSFSSFSMWMIFCTVVVFVLVMAQFY